VTGAVNPREIVAVIGKTHGNGLVNDYTRGFLTQSLALLISATTGETPDGVRARIPFIFSGGVEGVLSPHYSVFTVAPSPTDASGKKALAIGVAFTPELKPGDVGRQRPDRSDSRSGDPRDAFGEDRILRRRAFRPGQGTGVHAGRYRLPMRTPGAKPASDNPGKLMGLGRAASALGVGKALGEVSAERAVESAVAKDFDLYSRLPAARPRRRCGQTK